MVSFEAMGVLHSQGDSWAMGRKDSAHNSTCYGDCPLVGGRRADVTMRTTALESSKGHFRGKCLRWNWHRESLLWLNACQVLDRLGTVGQQLLVIRENGSNPQQLVCLQACYSWWWKMEPLKLVCVFLEARLSVRPCPRFRMLLCSNPKKGLTTGINGPHMSISDSNLTVFSF